jgi:glutamyl-tRNA(Gln) amidotransferase subunit E
MGEIDRAAKEASEKKHIFTYQALKSTCLVENDDEPPHDVNREALAITLGMAALLNAVPVDEVHFMRKVVVDGSNTSGFQRTALAALGGVLKTDEGDVGISTLCLEEDAARKIAQDDTGVTYRLDRLGIPLIEIATEPDIKTPEQTRNVAERIGALLRATKKVKRGIGTIREDLNISIAEGARVEIKGVQDLRKIAAYVEQEVRRQQMLAAIKKILAERNGSAEPPETPTILDVTGLMKNTQSKIIATALDKKHVVLGIRLRHFGGLLKSAEAAFGRELAQRVRVLGIRGLFHSDELPDYGISEAEVAALRARFDLGDDDAFIIIAEKEALARTALERVIERAHYAYKGVPEETRDAQDDGTTRYSRPLPGAARMYPETDVRPIRITAGMRESIKNSLPEFPEVTIKRFVADYGIGEEQARQIVFGGQDAIFEELSKKYGVATIVARTLLNTLPEIEKEGAPVDRITDAHLRAVFDALQRGVCAKEAIPMLLARLAKTPDEDAETAIKACGLGAVDEKEFEAAIQKIVNENAALIEQKGMHAVSALMGIAMKRFRGAVDGKAINEAVKKAIDEKLKNKN